MFKVKFRKVILTFSILFVAFIFIILIFSKYSYAKTEKIQNEKWTVKITNLTKDLTLKDTQDIKFVVQDNQNILNGKIAPGITAISVIDIDMMGVTGPVEITLNANTMNIPKDFELSAEIDNEQFEIGKTKLFGEAGKRFDNINGNKKIVLKLTWEDNDDNSKEYSDLDSITIPIEVIVRSKN